MDIYDLISVGRAYGPTDPYKDLNGDMDIYYLITVAINYGKTR